MIEGTIPSRCSISVTSRCSGRISACPSRSASCCALTTASWAFSVYLLIFMIASPSLELLEGLVVLTLFRAQRAGQLHFHGRIQIAAVVGLADLRHAVSLQPEDLTVLR